MAGSSMKDIKNRIKSVESTKQITKAMELAAVSKLRRAKERIAHSRPYFEILKQTIADIEACAGDAKMPFYESRENGKACIIVIGGDRGLAGGYNNNILKPSAEECANILQKDISKSLRTNMLRQKMSAWETARK